MEEFPCAYTFDDVALVPQYNDITSRTEPKLKSWLTKCLEIEVPILCSNMDTVINEALADTLIAYGSIPIFHRFTDFEVQKAWVKKYGEKSFVSSGLLNLDEVRALLDLGAGGVCIDVAHGHSLYMTKFLEELKQKHPETQVIAGNVCTPMAFHDLVSAGADAVKVGIGPGAACTTRMVTGFGMPQFSAIYECARIAEKLRIPLIADGGIRSGRDIVLALAAGASSVMVGKLFAATCDSAAPKSDDGKLAKYRGQASEDFQNEFYGGLKEMTVAEGTDFWIDVNSSSKELMEELLGSLRSAMTYGGARSIKELQRKAEFVSVTGRYLRESKPRPNPIGKE